jgi:hypothetical protein
MAPTSGEGLSSAGVGPPPLGAPRAASSPRDCAVGADTPGLHADSHKTPGLGWEALPQPRPSCLPLEVSWASAAAALQPLPCGRPHRSGRGGWHPSCCTLLHASANRRAPPRAAGPNTAPPCPRGAPPARRGLPGPRQRPLPPDTGLGLGAAPGPAAAPHACGRGGGFAARERARTAPRRARRELACGLRAGQAAGARCEGGNRAGPVGRGARDTGPAPGAGSRGSPRRFGQHGIGGVTPPAPAARRPRRPGGAAYGAPPRHRLPRRGRGRRGAAGRARAAPGTCARAPGACGQLGVSWAPFEGRCRRRHKAGAPGRPPPLQYVNRIAARPRLLLCWPRAAPARQTRSSSFGPAALGPVPLRPRAPRRAAKAVVKPPAPERTPASRRARDPAPRVRPRGRSRRPTPGPPARPLKRHNQHP